MFWSKNGNILKDFEFQEMFVAGNYEFGFRFKGAGEKFIVRWVSENNWRDFY